MVCQAVVAADIVHSHPLKTIMISIRRIHLHEGSLYRRMRLASLSDSPSAFATTLESANSRSLESWNEQADSTAVGTDRVTIFAFVNDEPVGIAALYRDDQNRDSGEVIQFWVDPAHRGGLVAGKLIEWLFSWARKHDLQRLSAWVNNGNERAIQFYRKHGFELTNETKLFRPGSELVSCLMTKQMRVEQSTAADADPRRGESSDTSNQAPHAEVAGEDWR
jgi:GNAT superfamily N-acetyltransferase